MNHDHSSMGSMDDEMFCMGTVHMFPGFSFSPQVGKWKGKMGGTGLKSFLTMLILVLLLVVIIYFTISIFNASFNGGKYEEILEFMI